MATQNVRRVPLPFAPPARREHTSGWAAAHRRLELRSTAAMDFLDVTEPVVEFLRGCGLSRGTVTVQSRHTTCAIVVNEHEPLLLEDFRRTLERAAPTLFGYAHDDLRRRTGVGPEERVNGHAHCRALLLPSSATLVVEDGLPCLGRWQRVFLVELDGPQRREIDLVAMGVFASA